MFSFYNSNLSFLPDDLEVSPDTRIHKFVNIYGTVKIGKNTIISSFVEIHDGAIIGSNVKIQSFCFIPKGVTIEDGVFVGPGVVFTNDKYPSAINKDGTLKGPNDWEITPTLVKRGAAIGANSTIVCGVTIGEFSVVGSGSVVTKSVPPGKTVKGNPAK